MSDASSSTDEVRATGGVTTSTTTEESSSTTSLIPTRIELGPLTTTFSRSASQTGCSTLRFVQDLTTLASVAYGLDCNFSVARDCYPGVFGQVYNDEGNRNIDAAYQPAVFSPGNACPAGYVTACSYERRRGTSKSEDGEWESTWSRFDTTITGNIWDYMEDGETAIGCCPSGYECPTASPTLCFSVVPPPGTVSLVTYESDHCASSTSRFSFDSDQASELYTRTTTVANRFGVVAHAPRVVLVQTEDSSSSTTTTSGSAPGTDSGGPANTNTVDGGGSGGLSSGAKVAIGLGVAMPMLAVIAAGLFLFFFLRRRRAAKAAAAAGENENPTEKGEAGEGGPEDADFKAELHGTSGALAAGGAGVPFAKPELDSAAVQELQGAKDDGLLKPELDGQVVRELQGDVATSELGTEHTVVAELPDSQTAAAASSVQSGMTNGEARERDHTTSGLWDWSQPLETSPSVNPGVNTAATPGLGSAVSPEEDPRTGRR